MTSQNITIAAVANDADPLRVLARHIPRLVGVITAYLQR